MRFLVLVTLDLDEPDYVSRETVRAGYQWLVEHLDSKVLIEADAYDEPYSAPGGYMLVNVPNRDSLDQLLATHPLRSTITVDIRPLTTLRAGFTKLLAKVDARDQGTVTTP